MSINNDIPELERPAFFDGQRLTAADLTAVQSYHRELRWLHNRSLHNWGIAFGLAVTGLRGERTVRIQPGYALDCKGRDLILSESLEMPIPPEAGDGSGGPVTYYLTASYAEDADLTPETRNGACGSSGAVRRPEEPIIRWQNPDDNSGDSRFTQGIDVVLASIKVQNCQLLADISGSERRDAVPAQQPYVASGQSKAGKTQWRLWQPNDDGELTLGIITTVTTTDAGFRTTPRYQAHVIGPRVFSVELNNEPFQVVLDGYTQVLKPGAGSFDLVMTLPQGRIGDQFLNPQGILTEELMDRLSNNAAGDLGWVVVWMGVEGS
jgi:hypothetical protein